ncbi:MAG: PDZ domain-containing protein [Bacteroidota bacterium]
MLKTFTRLILLQCFIFSYGQSAKEQLEIVNSAEIIESEFYEEIAFEDKYGYFTIPVSIGATTYQYIFDTGGYNTLTSQILSDHKLPELMTVEVGSVNQIKSEVRLTKIPSLKIGNLEIKDVGALNLDFDASPSIKCYTNGGLLGKSVIKNAVWQINAQDKKMIITDNISKLSNLDNAIKIKVKLDKVYNPFIKAKLNGKTYNFLLDFGFGGLLSLTEKTGKDLKTDNIVEVMGEGAAGANGILEEPTFIKDVEHLSIGKLKLANKFAYYAKSKKYNLIGTEITKHFIVTLNFKEKELYLTPISINEAQTEKEQSTFGFSLNRNDTNVYVSNIFKGGSAEKSGLQLKDILLSINGKDDFMESSYCDFYNYFKALSDGDDDIVLIVKRGDSEETIRIRKTKLFE